MKGLGIDPGGGGGDGGEMEPEEGEAFLGKGEDACIDPDVDLYYIDVKLQDVLGLLQKEFEGGVSVENLGPKFGGYGSFLSTCKRSPSILSQPGSSPKDPGRTVASSSSHRLSCESACNDSSAQINAPISNSSYALTKNLNLGDLARKDDSTTATATTNHIEDNGLINKGSGGRIQTTLKFRIKVGPDNISPRSNTSIYSRLGLELSPSLSVVDSSEEIKGISEDSATNVSPSSILQMMTGFSISEGCFLSPLHENLPRLTEAGDHSSGNHEGDIFPKFIPESISVSDKLNSTLSCSESCRENAMKLLPENIQKGGNKSKLTDEKALVKKVNVETLEGWDLTYQTSNIFPMLNSGAAESKIMVRKVASKVQEDSVKITTKTFNPQLESSRMLLNDYTFHPGIGNRNSFELKRRMEIDGIVGLKEKTVSIKVELCPRINLTRRDSVEKNMICGKNGLLCLQKECMDKLENVTNLNEVELDGPKVYQDHIFGTNEFIKLNNAQKTAKLPEIKGKLKATASNAISVSDPPRKTVVSLALLSGKEEKKFHEAGVPAKNKSKRPKSLTESSHDYPKHSQKEVSLEGKSELVVRRMKRTPLIAKNRLTDIKIAKKKSRVRLFDNKSNAPLSFEAPIETCTDVLISDHSATDSAIAPGPIVIKDNWACCDLCEKWRLLPNGTNPDDLPKKWSCTMQFWLPAGMNHCLISEDETTNMMNSQCQIFLLVNNFIPDHSVPSASSATLHVNQVACQISSIMDMKCDQVKSLSDTAMKMQKQKLKGKGKSFQCSSNGVNIRQGKDSKLLVRV